MASPKVMKSVLCPTCQSQAEVRQRQGKYKQLDLKCPSCGVLNYQTKSGQAFLAGLETISKPESNDPLIPENKPEYSGLSGNTFFD